MLGIIMVTGDNNQMLDIIKSDSLTIIFIRIPYVFALRDLVLIWLLCLLPL
jgi:hypothetical protein